MVFISYISILIKIQTKEYYMKMMSFSCGDKVSIQGKNRIEKGIVCQYIETTDEKMKVRVVTEDGNVIEKAVGAITKR